MEKKENKDTKEKKKMPKANSKYRITKRDLDHYLASIISTGPEGAEEKLPFGVINNLTRIIFGVISDILVEGAVVEINDFGTFIPKFSEMQQERHIKFSATKEYRTRLNKTGTKASGVEYSIVDMIENDRIQRLRWDAEKRKEAIDNKEGRISV